MHLESVADLAQRQLALLVNDSRASTSNRLKFRPTGASAASIRPERIWCARVMEVAAVIASTAAQPAPRQLAAASSIGSKSSVIVQ